MIEYCYCLGFAHKHTSTTSDPVKDKMKFKELEAKIDIYTGCITLAKLLTPKIFQKEK
jgi:hypothetical protein